MDKIKIGIPRSLNYYYFSDLWINFFEYLNFDVVISPPTNKDMLDKGNSYVNDEMCLSLKIYLSHVNYLKDKCDYVIVPRIDNYGLSEQTCTNFLALYDLINNLFDIKILNYNISSKYFDNELYGFIRMGKTFGIKRSDIIRAYKYALAKSEKAKKKKILNNYQNIKSDKLKVLIVSHPYNIYDDYFGKPIIKLLQDMDVVPIYSDGFNSKLASIESKNFSHNLYWKYSKEAIGSIKLVEKDIDGIIFLSSFPCGPDSLVNELVMRKIKIPYLNLITDDMDALTGFETRIESFIDIIHEKQTN